MEFAEGLDITYVMGGLAREFDRPVETMRQVLDAAEASGMPVDPRLWLDNPPSSSYPACQGVKAAAEQGLDGPYLRLAREGLMVDRLKLDNAAALVELAGHVPGMDVGRFEIDLRSHAIAEAFAADLDRTRAAAPETHTEAMKRVPLPSFEFRAHGDRVRGAYDERDPAALAEAAMAVGATPHAARPGVEEALKRFGRMATPEVAVACALPGPHAAAELWRLATEWRVRAEQALTGELWQAA